ncbi:retron system putative HNH endonuclease [Roseinatronobacter monicus]|uniref:retron system putative HNH endonuclease n=1 Tax=Roseinatronobacter monicus TaxID=393481 RepID=UPI003F2EF707
MKGARKINPPQCYIDWLNMENDDWKPSYPFNDPKVRRSVVQSLFEAQRGICVYCGRKLDMSSPGKTYHVEHFRPQTRFLQLATDYSNLFISCGQNDQDGNQSQTCGTHKSELFEEELHVVPEYPHCTMRFRFLLNGRIKESDPSDEAAKLMIELLNLNHLELSKEREQLLILIDSGDLETEDFWDEETASAESFAHMAYQHAGNLLP